jgi:3-phenylpropionate/trans-cinnamate dioxygenase ferredoxin subunit
VSDWIDVKRADAIVLNEPAIVELDDTNVAVFNVGGAFFAIQDVCTHDGEELTGGPVEGDEIICPRHGARFCIRTGAALSPPAYEPVHCFPVRVVGGIVQVRDDRFD